MIFTCLRTFFEPRMRKLTLNENFLGNPEDLRDGVGDIFACKVMQIPNLETVFESEQI